MFQRPQPFCFLKLSDNGDPPDKIVFILSASTALEALVAQQPDRFFKDEKTGLLKGFESPVFACPYVSDRDGVGYFSSVIFLVSVYPLIVSL
jgi:hypothetical protein